MNAIKSRPPSASVALGVATACLLGAAPTGASPQPDRDGEVGRLCVSVAGVPVGEKHYVACVQRLSESLQGLANAEGAAWRAADVWRRDTSPTRPALRNASSLLDLLARPAAPACLAAPSIPPRILADRSPISPFPERRRSSGSSWRARSWGSTPCSRRSTIAPPICATPCTAPAIPRRRRPDARVMK